MPKPSGWRCILTLFTLATFRRSHRVRAARAFAPLQLPTVGVAPKDVPIVVGRAHRGGNVLGDPRLSHSKP
jgi:hypothetical protein